MSIEKRRKQSLNEDRAMPVVTRLNHYINSMRHIDRTVAKNEIVEAGKKIIDKDFNLADLNAIINHRIALSKEDMRLFIRCLAFVTDSNDDMWENVGEVIR